MTVNADLCLPMFVHPVPDNPPYIATVGNLPHSIFQVEVEDLFKAQKVNSVRMVRDKAADEFTVTASVEFADHASLLGALKFNGKILKGKALRVVVAEPRGPRGRGGDRGGPSGGVESTVYPVDAAHQDNLKLQPRRVVKPIGQVAEVSEKPTLLGVLEKPLTGNAATADVSKRDLQPMVLVPFERAVNSALPPNPNVQPRAVTVPIGQTAKVSEKANSNFGGAKLREDKSTAENVASPWKVETREDSGSCQSDKFITDFPDTLKKEPDSLADYQQAYPKLLREAAALRKENDSLKRVRDEGPGLVNETDLNSRPADGSVSFLATARKVGAARYLSLDRDWIDDVNWGHKVQRRSLKGVLIYMAEELSGRRFIGLTTDWQRFCGIISGDNELIEILSSAVGRPAEEIPRIIERIFFNLEEQHKIEMKYIPDCEGGGLDFPQEMALLNCDQIKILRQKLRWNFAEIVILRFGPRPPTASKIMEKDSTEALSGENYWEVQWKRILMGTLEPPKWQHEFTYGKRDEIQEMVRRRGETPKQLSGLNWWANKVIHRYESLQESQVEKGIMIRYAFPYLSPPLGEFSRDFNRRFTYCN